MGILAGTDPEFSSGGPKKILNLKRLKYRRTASCSYKKLTLFILLYIHS